MEIPDTSIHFNHNPVTSIHLVYEIWLRYWQKILLSYKTLHICNLSDYQHLRAYKYGLLRTFLVDLCAFCYTDSTGRCASVIHLDLYSDLIHCRTDVCHFGDNR